jgi:hypothetical protein
MADIDNIPQLLTIDQLAERLGVTERYWSTRGGCHTESSASSSASPTTRSPPGSKPPAGPKTAMTAAPEPIGSPMVTPIRAPVSFRDRPSCRYDALEAVVLGRRSQSTPSPLTRAFGHEPSDRVPPRCSQSSRRVARWKGNSSRRR